MVRAHLKQTPDPEKEEPHKKKAVSKKKASEAGTWPCKMNGCNKVFAREADLKRHQRTTKTHSMPGFACPQCDATFTRTDALRRHQKSRHNGVIIEPQDATGDDQNENGEASESRSSSRSGTPSGSNADPESANSSPQSAASQAASGPSSYYRPHTLQSSPYPPRPMSMDHYPPPIGIPTSAARLNGPGLQTPPTAAWPEGTPIPHPGMYPPPYYHPSPYYRPPLYPMHPPGYPPVHHEYMGQQYPYPMHPGPPMSFQGIMQPPLSAIPRGGSAGQIDEPTNGETEPGPNHEPPKKRRKWSHEDAVEGGSAPTTEPNGHSQPESNQAATPANRADTHLDASLMLDADEAATVVALLQQASGQAFSAHMSPPARLSDSPPHEAETLAQVTSAFIDDADVDADADADADADGEPDADGDADPDAEGEEVEAALELPTGSSSSYNAYITPSRQSPLDHILTEDGEPMLNPAELLTQESLASPPQA